MGAENKQKAEIEDAVCAHSHTRTLRDSHKGWGSPRVVPEWRPLHSPDLRPLVTKDAGSPSCGSSLTVKRSGGLRVTCVRAAEEAPGRVLAVTPGQIK